MIGGRYRKVRVIGRGGMGEVFLAEDTLLDRQVAVKHILRTDEDETTATQRLLREARSAARIHHPNVVAVHDLVVEGDDAYIVMEYVAAENLSQILRRGPITPERAAQIGAQVADALAAAHQLGIVHRDVKPSNILVDADDRAKLMDFGIARTVDDATLTRTGHMIGSVAFMAPEVARGDAVTPAADLYSLGATIFAAVEGRSPFAGENDSSTSVAMLVRLITQNAPPATKAGPLTDLIGRLLSTPDMRPPATEVATRLRSASTGSPSPVPVLTDEDPEELTEPTRIRPPVPAAPVPPALPVEADEVVAPVPRQLGTADETVAPPAGAEDDRTVLRQPAPTTPAGKIPSASPAPAEVSKAGLPAEPRKPPVTPGPLTPIQKQDRRRRVLLRGAIIASALAIVGAGTLFVVGGTTGDRSYDLTVAATVPREDQTPSTATATPQGLPTAEPGLTSITCPKSKRNGHIYNPSDSSYDLVGLTVDMNHDPMVATISAAGRLQAGESMYIMFYTGGRDDIWLSYLYGREKGTLSFWMVDRSSKRISVQVKGRTATFKAPRKYFSTADTVRAEVWSPSRLQDSCPGREGKTAALR